MRFCSIDATFYPKNGLDLRLEEPVFRFQNGVCRLV